MNRIVINKSGIRKSIIASAIILFGLLTLFILLRIFLDWPCPETEKTVLTGIFILCLLPFIFNIVEIIIERGGKIEYGNLKIDFSKVQGYGISNITVPANIGVRGQSVMDSGTMNILDALSEATSNSVVIIDLENGQAWWETRLLVLLSGAQRLKCPDRIVFVASLSGKQQCFVGWAKPDDLLNYLLKAHPKYKRAYYIAKAVSGQWNLVEPLYTRDINNNYMIPGALPWMQGEAIHKAWMAYDNNTGLPTELFEEQVLQNELGREIENQEGGKYITLIRLLELFDPVLIRDHIELSEPSDQQMKQIFKSDLAYIALSQDGIYTSLVSRFAIYDEIFKQLIG